MWILHSTSEPKYRRSNRIIFNVFFSVDYSFERIQLLKFEIRDYSVGSSVKNTVSNLIGTCVFNLGELIGTFGVKLQVALKRLNQSFLSTKTSIVAKSNGQLRVVPQGLYRGWAIVSARLPEKSLPVILQFSGKNLKKKNKFFDETSVFFVIHKLENDSKKKEIYRSEVIKNHSHPIWRPFNLHLRKIADHRNRDEMNKTGLIGSFLTTYAKMKYGPGEENVYNLINQKKMSKKGYLKSGTMQLIKFCDVSIYSFLDYITSGTQLHLAVAVDFSSELNICNVNDIRTFDVDFECTLRGVVNILRNYNPSKSFPTFGLGARIPPLYNNSDVFHLNFDVEPYCNGIEGILEAYRNARRSVMLSDRAEYLPVVNAVA
ncbi:Copine, partial [Onchocerca flexuosa]